MSEGRPGRPLGVGGGGGVETCVGGSSRHSATLALVGFFGHLSNYPCRETCFVSERWTEMTIVFRSEAA